MNDRDEEQARKLADRGYFPDVASELRKLIDGLGADTKRFTGRPERVMAALAAASELPTPELDELRVQIDQWLAERRRGQPLPPDWRNAQGRYCGSQCWGCREGIGGVHRCQHVNADKRDDGWHCRDCGFVGQLGVVEPKEPA